MDKKRFMPAKIEKIQMKNVGLSYHGSRCLVFTAAATMRQPYKKNR